LPPSNEPSPTFSHQLTEVQNAAHSLFAKSGERFLEGLARRLGDKPSDKALREAIAANFASIAFQLSYVHNKSGVQQMKRYHNRINDDAFEERGLLKDGHVYRPAGGLMMMDGAMPRRPNFSPVSTLDGDPMSLHRPGWPVPARDTCDPLPRHVVTDA
jgi:hypothetical protein